MGSEGDRVDLIGRLYLRGIIFQVFPDLPSPRRAVRTIDSSFTGKERRRETLTMTVLLDTTRVYRTVFGFPVFCTSSYLLLCLVFPSCLTHVVKDSMIAAAQNV